MRKIGLLFCAPLWLLVVKGQDIRNNPASNHGNKFEQLGTILPTANEYRTASGTWGPKYWQQRCDYDIVCELDEQRLQLRGNETVTYFNKSPDVLTYLWLQLDENEHDPNSQSNSYDESRFRDSMAVSDLVTMEPQKRLAGLGDKILSITDALNKPLRYTINQTMMRLELPSPLQPGHQYSFKIAWQYNIPDRITIGGRGGYEKFSADSNALFTMSQWYPRMCVYSDFQGWQNHQFTGRGEFALTFGNFKVRITAPADHVVCATGEGQNYEKVLTAAQLKRWHQAQTATEPMEIVTLEEATAAEKNTSNATKTWIFKADSVRDFAWGSSRKFVWDARALQVAGKKIMCMSFYAKEAYPLYRKFSTKAVAHTIKTYSNFTIPYPYPVAQSIEASNGMEYPMICFNNGRAEKDGSYSEATKNGMVGVIIHEVGHNFFPMIVNSDERQWSWMDEGLNTFVQYLTEELWDNKFPSGRGPAYKIVDYMKMPKNSLEPIMTNSENISNFGSNAYGKPATGLNILRETIMGRELFDYAFKEYARRWAFKHPTPADFFRTMEDASAVDLDWFWRGWFYGIEPCDISLDSVRVFRGVKGTLGYERRDTIKIDKPILNDFDDISKVRNREEGLSFFTDTDPATQDFYWKYARGLVKIDTTSFPVIRKTEKANEAAITEYAGNYYYELTCSNKGGLVMPLIVQFTFKDGTTKTQKIAAEIWRKNELQIKKVFVTDKEAVSILIDPMRETADINEKNNKWPVLEQPSRFQLFKSSGGGRRAIPDVKAPNPMQREIK
ncbi:MAG: M1 family metallopeptidase [Chitinophagaceae bacterium]